MTIAAGVTLDRLDVSEKDRFLVVCNPELGELAAAVAAAARIRTSRVNVHEFPTSTRDGEEPPPAVASDMRAATAVVLLTRFSLSHTKARLEATSAGTRIASLPGITRDVFRRTLAVDYDSLKRRGHDIARKLTGAARCHVTGPAGTDVQLSFLGRTAICDDGDLRAPGAFGNLPAGEAYIAPLETDATGTIVFDGSLAGWGLLEEPITVSLERGRLASVAGGDAAKWLLETLDAGGQNGRTIAELGIGTNPSATISGLILEDEKVEGTVHFAFGTNTSMGGANQASVHIDGLVRQAFVKADGYVLVRDGHLVE